MATDAEQSAPSTDDGPPTELGDLKTLGLTGSKNESGKAPTDKEIRRAYRKQAILHHPDRNPNDVDAATKRFKIIGAAYERLSATGKDKFDYGAAAREYQDTQERTRQHTESQKRPSSQKQEPSPQRAQPGQQARPQKAEPKFDFDLKFTDKDIEELIRQFLNGGFKTAPRPSWSSSAPNCRWDKGSSKPGMGGRSPVHELGAERLFSFVFHGRFKPIPTKFSLGHDVTFSQQANQQNISFDATNPKSINLAMRTARTLGWKDFNISDNLTPRQEKTMRAFAKAEGISVNYTPRGGPSESTHHRPGAAATA